MAKLALVNSHFKTIEEARRWAERLEQQGATLDDDEVTTDKILDANVTYAKLAADVTSVLTGLASDVAAAASAAADAAADAAAALAAAPKTIDDGGHVVQTFSPEYTFGIQVYDAVGNAATGIFQIEVWASTSSYGAPGGTQTFGAPSAGTILETVTADTKYIYQTNGSGYLEARVTAASAETRYVMASFLGLVLASSSLTFS